MKDRTKVTFPDGSEGYGYITGRTESIDARGILKTSLTISIERTMRSKKEEEPKLKSKPNPKLDFDFIEELEKL